MQSGSDLRRSPNTSIPLPINSAGNHSHDVTLNPVGSELRPNNVALIPAIKT
ncbi:MAG: hypothetical protein R3D70_09275 [Rhizobiaceae bacterium]